MWVQDCGIQLFHGCKRGSLTAATFLIGAPACAVKYRSSLAHLEQDQVQVWTALQDAGQAEPHVYRISPSHHNWADWLEMRSAGGEQLGPGFGASFLVRWMTTKGKRRGCAVHWYLWCQANHHVSPRSVVFLRGAICQTGVMCARKMDCDWIQLLHWRAKKQQYNSSAEYL